MVRSGNSQAGDISLHGCWRSQQVELTMADSSLRDINNDCVMEYGASRAHSRCYSETGVTVR